MAKWTHDGTQDPGPPPLMPDALTGSDDAEAVRVRVVEPPMPDITEVRRAMASVLDEDSELLLAVADVREQAREKVDDAGPATSEIPAQAPPAGADTPVAAAPAAAAAAPAAAAAAAAGAAPTAAAPPVVQSPPQAAPRVPIPVRMPGRRGERRLRRRQVRRSGGFSPGMAAIGLLLLVIAVLVVVMLASLINTISSIFS